MSERSFLRDPQPFLKKEKKSQKKVKKFQSGIFGLFWTDMASRLIGIDSTSIFCLGRLQGWAGYFSGR